MQAKRRAVWLAVAAWVIVLTCSAAGWWGYANQVPEYPPRSVRLPSPNAYDDYLAAAALLAKPMPKERPFDLPAQKRLPLLLRNRKALERLRNGFSHEYRNPPPANPDRDYPELPDLLTLGRLLILKGQQAEAEGDWANAAESYLRALQLGVDLPKGGTFAQAIYGVALQDWALEALRNCSLRLDESTSLSVLREMRKLNRTSATFREFLIGEREETLRFLSYRQRTIPPVVVAPVSHLLQAPVPAIEYLVTPKHQMFANYKAYMAAWIERAALPYSDPSPTPERPHDFINQNLVSSPDEIWRRLTRREAEWRLTEASLAIGAFKTAHGRLPDALEQLVPKYLLAVPGDPYAAQPLLFRRMWNAALVYSRGPDGDDDQGLEIGRRRPREDGDIVQVIPH